MTTAAPGHTHQSTEERTAELSTTPTLGPTHTHAEHQTSVASFHDGSLLAESFSQTEISLTRVKAVGMRYSTTPAILGYEVWFEKSCGSTFVYKHYAPTSVAPAGIQVKYKAMPIHADETIHQLQVQYTKAGIHFVQLITSKGRRQSFGYLFRDDSLGENARLILAPNEIFMGFHGCHSESCLSHIGLVYSIRQPSLARNQDNFRGTLIASAPNSRPEPNETVPLSPRLRSSLSVCDESQHPVSYVNPGSMAQLQTTHVAVTLLHSPPTHSANLVGVTGKGSTLLYTRGKAIFIGSLFLVFLLSSFGIIVLLFARNVGSPSVS